MSKARKTIKVLDLKNKINNLLGNPEIKLSQDQKMVLCTILEGILMDTGNYRGFNHVYWSKQGYQEWLSSGKPEDETKNQFIIGNLGEYARSYY